MRIILFFFFFFTQVLARSLPNVCVISEKKKMRTSGDSLLCVVSRDAAVIQHAKN